MQESDFLKAWRPGPPHETNDQRALQQGGLQTPPHLGYLSQIYAMGNPFNQIRALGEFAEQIQAHLNRLKPIQNTASNSRTIFVGHGRSPLWRELKDYLQDRLEFVVDEFNRVPTAGLSTSSRLATMLDTAGLAFLVMTAEDEQTNGTLRARENVVHEIGLLQGRLGFERAIVVLEEGCKEFSNISGLGQIRFPKGNISASFEEISRVLEREEFLER